MAKVGGRPAEVNAAMAIAVETMKKTREAATHNGQRRASFPSFESRTAIEAPCANRYSDEEVNQVMNDSTGLKSERDKGPPGERREVVCHGHVNNRGDRDERGK